MKKALLSLSLILAPSAGLAFAQTDSIESTDSIELYEQGPEALEQALAKEMTDENGWANSFW